MAFINPVTLDVLKNIMICPYCENQHKLTWKYYLKSNITFRYRCPSCSKAFKAKFNIFFFLEVLGFYLFMALPILFLMFFNGYSTAEVILYPILLPVPIIMIIDKNYDDKVEKIKIESEPNNREEFEKP